MLCMMQLAETQFVDTLQKSSVTIGRGAFCSGTYRRHGALVVLVAPHAADAFGPHLDHAVHRQCTDVHRFVIGHRVGVDARHAVHPYGFLPRRGDNVVGAVPVHLVHEHGVLARPAFQRNRVSHRLGRNVRRCGNGCRTTDQQAECSRKGGNQSSFHHFSFRGASPESSGTEIQLL